LNETTTLVQDAELRNGLLSITSKMQTRLAANGITALETWLQSVAPVTIENMPLSASCALCNVSLVASPSSPRILERSIVLGLRFVEPRLTPPSTIAGKRSDYWTEISKVYSECRRVLKPGGLLILVLKGFTRNGKYVDLPLQTRQCCEALDFRFVEQWERELWNLSFWRILQKRRDPAAFDDRLRYESVLVMER